MLRLLLISLYVYGSFQHIQLGTLSTLHALLLGPHSAEIVPCICRLLVFLQNMRIMILKCVFICYSKSAITEVAVKVLNIVDFVLWLLELFGFIKSVIVEQLRSSCCASLSSQQLRSAGFFCGQPCDMELVTRQSERPGHQQTGVHWRRFYFQLTCVHSTLELSGLCALQI